MIRKPLDRRTFLKGAGTLIALPFLEAMLPLRALASTAGAPQRFVACFFGIGFSQWHPTGTTNSWTLAPNQQPLAPYKDYISSIEGLTNDAGLFGTGIDYTTAHWQASTTYLTGQTYDWANRATRTALYSPGSSLDQMIAQTTPNNIKSLVMGTHPLYLYPGQTDTRGSGSFLTNVSWTDQNTITPRFVSSASVFNYLFSNGVPSQTNAAAQLRAAQKKSILDDVLGEIQKLQSVLGSSDKQKLDEYLTSVNEVETRIANEATAQNSCTVPNNPAYTSDTSNDSDGFVNPIVNQRSRNMSDMLTIAFQCDITRVSSFMFITEHNYEDIYYYDTGNGMHCRHHDASHGIGTNALDTVNAFSTWGAQQFAYLLGKLKNTSDVNGSLLDNTLLMCGSGMANDIFDDHDLTKVPMVLAGKGTGYVPGKFVQTNGGKHSDFLATIAQRFGLPAKIGMSTGTISNL